MFETFTERARKVMTLARQEAQRMGSDSLRSEHILLGILQEGSGTAAVVLKTFNVAYPRLFHNLERRRPPWGKDGALELRDLPLSSSSTQTIERAAESARSFGRDLVDTEHLLLGLLRDRETIAVAALNDLGVDFETARDRVLQVLQQNPPPEYVPQPSPTHAFGLSGELQAFRALTDRPALLDSLDWEIQQGRSIALIGPRAVGKSSLVLALARAKPNSRTIHSFDLSILHPFPRKEQPPRPDPGSLCFVPEGELFTVSRHFTPDLLSLRQAAGQRIILEFRDGGWEPFAARFPDLATQFALMRIAAPDPVESRDLLQSAVARLNSKTGYLVEETVLQEAERLCRERVRAFMAPWGTIRALWDAVPIQKDLTARGDMAGLEKDIERLEQEASPHVEALKRHLEGLRASEKAALSIDCVRVAIAKLARDSA